MSGSKATLHNKEDQTFAPTLIEAAKYLLLVDDPIREGKYFSGLQMTGLTSEPSETLSIVRSNAYVGLDLVEAGHSLNEDEMLFMKVEERIQSNELARHVQARHSGVDGIMIGIISVQGITILFLTGTNDGLGGFFGALLGLGGVAGMAAIGVTIRAHIAVKKIKRLLFRFRYALQAAV